MSPSIYGVSQYLLPSTYPPSSLKPESVKTWEVGLEANFFDNHLGIDFAYYDKLTTDQIMNIAVSDATGYSSMLINAGEIRNKGVELQLYITPIKTADWMWDITFNWSKDKSKIIELYTDPTTGQSLEQYTIGKNEHANVYIYAMPGKSWGTIYSTGMIQDAEGNYIVGANGLPKTKMKPIGNIAPNWLSGLRNTLSYKNLSLSFLLDYRNGGDFFSNTQLWASYSGLIDYTAEGGIRERSIVVGRDVLADRGCFVKEDGSINDIGIKAKDFFHSYNTSNKELSVSDGSYLKLREISLRYTFPKKMLEKTKFIKEAHVSLVGSNLAILWLHSSNDAHIDPETSNGSGNSGVGFEFLGYMPSRSFGAKVGLTF